MKGLLIIGHGSRSKQAVSEFETTVEMVRTKTVHYALVAGAHMELAEPAIPVTVENMVLAGITDITVVPYFLFNGNHIKQDIPEILAGQKQIHPTISFRFASPIGVEALMTDIIIKRAQEAE